MKNRLTSLAVGVALGAVVVLLYTLAMRPRAVETPGLAPLPAPYYSVLFENDAVRVVEHRLDPGESEPMHPHPPMIVYFMADARVRVTGPDGASAEESLRRGQVLELGALSHALENIGATQLHSILVEMKSGARRQ